MKRYRLSAAERPEVAAISDEIAAMLSLRGTNAIYALADVFVMMAGAARESGAIADEELGAIRAEIGVQLSPKTDRAKFTPIETTVLRTLGRQVAPVSAAFLAARYGMSRQSLNTILRSLIDKGAVLREMNGNTGQYWLAPAAESFREVETP